MNFRSARQARPAATGRGETLRGDVRAARAAGDGGFVILSVALDGGGIACVVGALLGIMPGDSIEAHGEWSDHPRFGQQFRARSCETTMPASESGTIAWMRARLPAVGPVIARALLARFGGAAGLWRAIENAPETLAEVRGITESRAKEISAAYEKFRIERDRMIVFRGWGLTANQVAKIILAWGEDAERRLRVNPYELIDAVDGFGFLRADELALRMGVPRDSEFRIEHGIRFGIDEASGRGHCYVPTGKLVAVVAEKVLRIDEARVREVLAKMRASGERVVGRGARMYSARIDRDEQRCADAVREFLGAPAECDADAEDASECDAPPAEEIAT